MDLSKISTLDLQHIQAGQWAKVSTAGLQEYQNQRQHEQQAQQQAQNPTKIPDGADKAAQLGQSNPQAVSNTPDSPLKKYLSIGQAKPQLAQQMLQPMTSDEKQGVQRGLENLAMAGVPSAGSFLRNAAQGMVLAGGQATGEGKDPRQAMGITGLLSLGLGAAGKTLGKLGDVGMQMGVGRSKYTPGVGTTLANEGIMGTRGQMQNQVANKLNDAGQAMSDVAKQVPPNVVGDASDIAAKIGQNKLDQLEPLFGQPSASDLPNIQSIKDFRGDISSRGPENVGEMLQRRAAAGMRSYKGRENPGLTLQSELSKQEQQGYSNAAKDLTSDYSPELGEKLENADQSYGALKRAEKSLSGDTTLPRSLFGMASTPLARLPGLPIVTTGVSQAATKGSQLEELLQSLYPQIGVQASDQQQK